MNAVSKSLPEAVAEQIRQKTGRRIKNLSVEVSGETVVLRGWASTFHVKQLAQHGVREMLPQMTVRNTIQVG